MSNFFSPRGGARRAKGTARRRDVRFAPSTSESLESRQLLAAGALGMNVEISPYASYVNWLQQAGGWVDVPGNSNPIVLNSSGDPTSDASIVFDLRVNQAWNGPDPNATEPLVDGTYHLSFNGQATIQPIYPNFSVPFTIQNQAYNQATNTTTADLVVAPANGLYGLFGIDFVNTQATPSSALNTGFSNARMIRPGYAANSTQVFTNEFVAALKPYGVLRYLDPEATNSQPYMSGNTLVTVDAPQVDQTGTPWEYLVTLANQTQTDMWINIPQGATDAYVAAVAGIIKNGGTVDGVSYPGLDPNLKVYLEYSNEVWGGIPGNQAYQLAAVQNNAANAPLSTFPGNLDIYSNVDGTTTTDPNTAMGRRYLERTYDLGQIFQSVLGSDPTHQRIRPVLGWQEGNAGFYPPALNWFEHFFGPASSAFYGLGDANYWNPSDYTSVDTAINTLAAGETSYSIQDTTNFTTIATAYGLKNVAYEGGPSIGTNSSTAAGQVGLAASRDPRMEQIVYQHYVDFYAAGGTLGMYFNGPFGTLSPANQWPIAELAQLTNPSTSSRYRGTVDVANASPVAVTAGRPVSASAPTSFGAATDDLGNNLSRPTTGQQGIWLLNVAAAGTYDLTMSTAVPGGTMPGQVILIVNDKPSGIINVTASSTIDLGKLNLSSGLNAISLEVVHGSFDPSQGNPFYYQFQPTTFTLTPTTSSSSLPSLGAIPSQTIGPSPASLTLTLQGSDPNNYPLTYSASAQPLPYALNQAYGFYEDVNGYHTNYRGQQEKYLRAKVSADGYDGGGGDYWYYILPDGDLYEFTPPYANGPLAGAFVASLGAAAYNDPSLLWGAQPAAVPVSLAVSGDQLTIAPASGYAGTFAVVATVSDGHGNQASQPFDVTVTSSTQPVSLGAILAQTIGPSPASLTLTLQGSDPNNYPLTYSASAQPLPYALNQAYGFYEDVNGYHTNYRGQQEKYLRAKVSADGYDGGGGDYWYYILPDGDLYEFTPPYANGPLAGAFVAGLGAAAYNDPSLLWGAQPAAVPVSLAVSGDQLTVASPSGYAGTFVVVAAVDDGHGNQASRRFDVTVVPVIQPPSLGAIPSQTIGASPASLTLTLQGSDPNNYPLTYSASAQPLPYALNQAYGFYEDVNGYHTNYRGQQEKYLRAKVSADGYDGGGGDYWYYILPDGDLYEFTPPYANGPLAGAFVASLGAAAYNDPSLLWGAQPAAVPVSLAVSGDQLTIAPASGYAGTFAVVATVDDGRGHQASRRFNVTIL